MRALVSLHKVHRSHSHRMSSTLVAYSERLEGKVGLVTLNNPDKMNAMTENLGNALVSVLSDIPTHVRAIIITGAGRAFSAGGDLNWLMDRHRDDKENNERIMFSFYKKFLDLRSIPVPIIAAINGPAIGAGLAMAMGLCDIRVASKKATMGLTFTKLGLHPGMGSLHFAPLLVGSANAADLLLTGRVIKADEAFDMGLISRVCEGDVVEEGLALAEDICNAAPMAVETTVMALRQRQDATGLGLDESLKLDAKSQALTYNTQDFAEGLASLKEKRSPNFIGS